MALELFGFVFNIIGSMLAFWVNTATLSGSVTFGTFIIAAFLICFVIGKVLGIASRELSDTESDLYDGMKENYHYSMYPRKHSSNYPSRFYSPRHNSKSRGDD